MPSEEFLLGLMRFSAERFARGKLAVSWGTFVS
jgi:hypothetical protein